MGWWYCEEMADAHLAILFCYDQRRPEHVSRQLNPSTQRLGSLCRNSPSCSHWASGPKSVCFPGCDSLRKPCASQRLILVEVEQG